MSLDIETVYGLLPAVYRTRDAAIAESLDALLTPAEQIAYQTLRTQLAQGGGLTEDQQEQLARLEEKRLRGPLKSVLTIIVEQMAALEENVEQLYDDQFIETCAEWVVPYIADLIGYRSLDPRLQARLGSARAEVANTIRLRRRKGTAAVLEELAVNVTDWDAAVVEFFLRLATTQHMNHIRLGHAAAPDLRRMEHIEAIDTPFDGTAHTADVRRIAQGRGRYNIPNVGIFLWRVRSRKLTGTRAFAVDARRYLFNPLGANTQLYNRAERDLDVTELAKPLDVPLPITRRGLRRDLEKQYGPGLSFSIQVGNTLLTAAEVESCDLSDTGPNPDTSPWAHSQQALVAVDPELGRIYFPAAVNEPVRVNFYYGFTAPLGGGEYDRTKNLAPFPDGTVPTDWPNVGQDGLVIVGDNGPHAGVPLLQVAANSRLEVRAANERRPLLQLNGDLAIGGGDSGEVTLSGLVIAGGRIVVPVQVNGQDNRLQTLRLVHCTLVPGGGLTRDGSPAANVTSIEVAAPNVKVEIDHCIVGGARVAQGSSLSIAHSIVDGLGPDQVAYAALDSQSSGGELTVDCCTLIGKVTTRLLTASNTIFFSRLQTADPWRAPVIAEQRQQGYVRYSFVPIDAELPARYACWPKVAAVVNAITPRFTSLRYGHPAYCQLHATCPDVIRRGAADEGEMGAFHDQYAPQREDGLQARLEEYLRFGLETGLFFAS